MTEKSWKAFERRAAKALGTRRIPVTGERAGADVEDAMFAYQVKLGRAQPSYLRRWLAGIVGAGLCRRPAKIGVVVWKPKGSRDTGALVILRFSDWVDLHGGAAGRPGASLEAFGPQSGDPPPPPIPGPQPGAWSPF